jgi:acyl-CoA synthetase (AMP-forming)/AMP-acid ligase II
VGDVSNWNFANVWRAISGLWPNEIAIEQGDRVVTWSEFAEQSEGLASWLLERELPLQSSLALYLHNCPEYLIGFAGALNARLVPMNTNYRYKADELIYLFDNAEARVVIFHGTFTEQVEEARKHLPLLQHFVHVDDHTTPCPSWATPFTDVAHHQRSEMPTGSGDDLLLLYTGGTTGLPKGVMWRQDDLFARLNEGASPKYPVDGDVSDVVAMLKEIGPGRIMLPACPLMHGTGLFSAMRNFMNGGRIVLLSDVSYDPEEMARVITERGVQVVVIVGDPFARPLLRVLDNKPDTYSLRSVEMMGSSGAMWSEEIKQGLLKHNPSMLCVDTLGSSEALGLGGSIFSGDRGPRTAQFSAGADVRVISDEGRDVQPGSDEIGRVMLGGRLPLGYFRDPEKTLRTFPVLDGVRYSVPGDMAKVNRDGSIVLLGRGSQCINTGGEKVFPEEVEEALKKHPSVADACVLGVPDETFGQRVVAVVELHPNEHFDEHGLVAFVKTHLAAYKAPKLVRHVGSIGRAVNGKMDYARHHREMLEWLQSR